MTKALALVVSGTASLFVALTPAYCKDPIWPKPLSSSVNLTTGNTAQRVGDREWDWWIFLLGSQDALKHVECVNYFLHSSFPNPIQEVCDGDAPGDKGFLLTAHGWGTFTVNVKVTFKDGSVRSLQHDLSFKALAEGWATVVHDSFDSTVFVPVSGALAKQGSFRFTFALERKGNESVNVTLRSIEVFEDGSKMTTPWTFEILINEQRQLYLNRRQYNDVNKPSIVRPRKGDVATATIKYTPSFEIRILGYKG